MIVIRPATPADVPLILRFIRELAAYEREPDAVLTTEADLLRDGWGATPRFRAIIAEHDGDPRRLRPLLRLLQHLARPPRHPPRRPLRHSSGPGAKGIGRALLRHLAQIAVTEGCPRLEWDVLTWNAPAIAFYQSLGATTQEEWRIMRLADDALSKVAKPDS